jgi:hypothetical protein
MALRLLYVQQLLSPIRQAEDRRGVHVQWLADTGKDALHRTVLSGRTDDFPASWLSFTRPFLNEEC